jgi:tRNA(adenine34) deaminase
MTGGAVPASASLAMSFPLPPPMRRALDLAAVAAGSGEVPVGAVITLGDEIIAEARNAMRGSLDPTAHAEMVAIRHAATRLGQPRLDGCTLWVTLEPCAMCAAAIALSRIEALRFGAEDPKGGGVVSGPRFFSQPTCHHRPDVLGGIGEEEASAQLRAFFQARRDPANT